MKRPAMRLSRPIYEAMPWLYILGGVLALAASYRHQAHGLIATLTGLVGIVGVLGGVVLLLRRRDFRQMRSYYADEDSQLPSQRDK